MKKALLILCLVALGGFSGCDTVVPKTADQIVYDATAAYGAALTLEVTYAKLPRCTPTAPPLCSDPATVLKVAKIDDATWTAIQAAQQTVRTAGFGDSVLQSAATAASNAANAFKQITQQLKVR